MSMQRKYKVTTTITQFMWASSRDDAAKYQEELIQKGKLDALRHGLTDVKFCFVGGEDFVEAPEDISKTRNPAEEPRRGDWIEIEHGDAKACALVRRLTRRKVYYYEAHSRTQRSVDREQWQRWAKLYDMHPAYDGVVPPFIVQEAVEAHESRGMLSGFSATPDSSLILEILDKYGYVPDDYEVENGYWAEIYIDRAISERILASHSDKDLSDAASGGDLESGDFSVGFSEELPTMDDFERRF